MRYLKFSPTFEFFRKIRRVDWQIATDVSDKPSGFVFWVTKSKKSGVFDPEHAGNMLPLNVTNC
jgi:hypothetical protein